MCFFSKACHKKQEPAGFYFVSFYTDMSVCLQSLQSVCLFMFAVVFFYCPHHSVKRRKTPWMFGTCGTYRVRLSVCMHLCVYFVFQLPSYQRSTVISHTYRSWRIHTEVINDSDGRRPTRLVSIWFEYVRTDQRFTFHFHPREKTKSLRTCDKAQVVDSDRCEMYQKNLWKASRQTRMLPRRRHRCTGSNIILRERARQVS